VKLAVLSTVAFAAVLGMQPSPAQAQPAARVDVCHRTGHGRFVPVSVSGNALPAHLAHGDAQPNDLVPGSSDTVFSASCGAVSWAYSVNATLDASAQAPGGTMLVGSGIPADEFGTARNEAEGIELGLGIIYRQGPSVSSTDDYADGVLEFQVNPGSQSTANGSSQTLANRAAWNFNFSIATGLNGATTDLGDLTVQLLYDVDPGAGTEFRVLTLEPGAPVIPGGSGYQWRDEGSGLVFIADDKGSTTVTQNSENYAFAFFQSFLTSAYGPGNGFAGPARFDIVLRAFNGPQLVAQNQIAVNVAP
jgi:hypothetical protein